MGTEDFKLGDVFSEANVKAIQPMLGIKIFCNTRFFYTRLKFLYVKILARASAQLCSQQASLVSYVNVMQFPSYCCKFLVPI